MALLRGLFALKDATRGTTALEARIALAQLLVGTTGLAVRPGVLPASDLPTALVTGTASWEYSIDKAAFVVSRGEAAGAILLANDAAATIACTAAPGSNSRYDLIWVRHPSNAEYAGDTDSVPIFGVTEGTAAASPTKPYGSEPTGALVLAEALVTAGDADTSEATITQVFPFAGLRGAPILVRNTTERDALDAGTNGPVDAWRLDAATGLWREISDDGSAWHSIDTVVSGRSPVKTYYVADTTARTALASAFSPSASNPLFVYRGDATAGREREYTENGTDWIVQGIGSGDVTSGTVTAVSTITIDDIEGFNEYEITLDIPTCSTANDVTAQLRAGGVTQTTGYDAQLLLGSASTATAAATYAQSSWALGSGSRADKHFVLRLSRLNEAVRTFGMLTGAAKDSGANAQKTERALWHTPATACDGIIFTASTGTVTGTYNVRGLC